MNIGKHGSQPIFSRNVTAALLAFFVIGLLVMFYFAK